VLPSNPPSTSQINDHGEDDQDGASWAGLPRFSSRLAFIGAENDRRAQTSASLEPAVICWVLRAFLEQPPGCGIRARPPLGSEFFVPEFPFISIRGCAAAHIFAGVA
jgi:hypothetical protein